MRLRHKIAAFISAAVMICCTAAAAVSAEDSYQNQRDEVIMLVNEQRTAQGLGELYESELLNQAAQIRAQEIITKFDHIRPDGRASYTVLTDLNGSYGLIGENIAMGFSTEKAVMDAWMNSEGHSKNILHPSYRAMGVGVAVQGRSVYWVQTFSDGQGMTPLYFKGNINRDGIINTEDAALVLKEAAAAGTGNSILNRMQKKFSDLDQDQLVSAGDASVILRYAAYAGAGGTGGIEQFIE